MAASTITRDTWTNDTGSAATPVGDGTLLTNTVLQNHIYARIDALFASGTFTFGGLVAAEGFGTHSFSGGGTGQQRLSVRNTSAGTGNLGALDVGNDVTALSARVLALSSTYTTASQYIADSAVLEGIGAGGVGISSNHASGSIKFWVNSIEKGRYTTVGLDTLVADGSVSVPSLRFGSNPDTGLFYGSGQAVSVAINGVEATTTLTPTSSGHLLSVNGGSFGTGAIPGSYLSTGRNASGSGAAGCLELVARNGTAYYLWVESATGKLRIHTSRPTEDNSTVADSAGTVVGTQT